jgi:hypothetical protein
MFGPVFLREARCRGTERRDAAVVGAKGKRLYYKSPVAKPNPTDPPTDETEQIPLF